jgi:hypothetical protein
MHSIASKHLLALFRESKVANPIHGLVRRLYIQGRDLLDRSRPIFIDTTRPNGSNSRFNRRILVVADDKETHQSKGSFFRNLSMRTAKPGKRRMDVVFETARISNRLVHISTIKNRFHFRYHFEHCTDRTIAG